MRRLGHGGCSAKSYYIIIFLIERPSEATFQDHLSSEIVFAIIYLVLRSKIGQMFFLC